MKTSIGCTIGGGITIIANNNNNNNDTTNTSDDWPSRAHEQSNDQVSGRRLSRNW